MEKEVNIKVKDVPKEWYKKYNNALIKELKNRSKIWNMILKE